jgi:hypothetical protein
MRAIKERELGFSEAIFLMKDRDRWKMFVRRYCRSGADGRDQRRKRSSFKYNLIYIDYDNVLVLANLTTFVGTL